MPPLATDLFDYTLPERLIAQTPAAQRDRSRLLVVDRQTGRLDHRVFAELPDLLQPSDLLVRNNAAVLPARLHARRPTGGAVECLLLRPAASGDPQQWWCLVRPGRKLAVGATFAAPPHFTATVLEKQADGTTRVAFETPRAGSIAEVANQVGRMPLPPYIERNASDEATQRHDLSRYQTVYAETSRQVAVAAPTAGLHFTADVLDRLKHRGIATADITLHVGLGTFRPIATADVDEHVIHRELYEMLPETQQAVTAAGRRRVAIGTTSVRAIEDFVTTRGGPGPEPHVAETGIFIRPPYRFRGVDALITNFHQPRSTLLCLVAAFLRPGSTDGVVWLKEIYAQAIAREYRFFSYGDAMLIL